MIAADCIVHPILSITLDLRTCPCHNQLDEHHVTHMRVTPATGGGGGGGQPSVRGLSYVPEWQ